MIRSEVVAAHEKTWTDLCRHLAIPGDRPVPYLWFGKAANVAVDIGKKSLDLGLDFMPRHSEVLSGTPQRVAQAVVVENNKLTALGVIIYDSPYFNPLDLELIAIKGNLGLLMTLSSPVYSVYNQIGDLARVFGDGTDLAIPVLRQFSDEMFKSIAYKYRNELGISKRLELITSKEEMEELVSTRHGKLIMDGNYNGVLQGNELWKVYCEDLTVNIATIKPDSNPNQVFRWLRDSVLRIANQREKDSLFLTSEGNLVNWIR